MNKTRLALAAAAALATGAAGIASAQTGPTGPTAQSDTQTVIVRDRKSTRLNSSHG